MNIVITEFIPLMLGAALVPVWTIIVLLLLKSEGGLLKAVAFVSGQILVRLTQGLAFGLVFGSSEAASTEQGAAIIVSTLLLVLGILLLITAFLKWRKQEDPDAPPPKWMTMFSSVSAGRAFLLSIGLMLVAAKQWVFTLGALGVIREAELERPENIIAYLIFVFGAQLLVLVPIVITAVAPRQASHLLAAGSDWLERNNRTIVVAVSVVFGAYFIFKGISGLLG
ncbi:MAG: GAP family protein [Anaerolineae bacterium]|nr:GAP family protein [Anaerolineae bacterium]